MIAGDNQFGGLEVKTLHQMALVLILMNIQLDFLKAPQFRSKYQISVSVISNEL